MYIPWEFYWPKFAHSLAAWKTHAYIQNSPQPPPEAMPWAWCSKGRKENKTQNYCNAQRHLLSHKRNSLPPPLFRFYIPKQNNGFEFWNIQANNIHHGKSQRVTAAHNTNALGGCSTARLLPPTQKQKSPFEALLTLSRNSLASVLTRKQQPAS